MTASWPRTERATATTKKRLEARPTSVRMRRSCDRELSALNMSKKTKQVKVIVVSRAVIWPSSIITRNTHRVPHIMMDADSSTFRMRPRLRIWGHEFDYFSPTQFNNVKKSKKILSF